MFNSYISCRYITKEELEQALQEQKLYDAEEFKEVISEADADNVRKKISVDSVHAVSQIHTVTYTTMDGKCIEIN
jgi:hypothetical protein